MRVFVVVALYLILACTSSIAQEEESEHEDEGKLLIGTFNIQVFGRTKVSKDEVVDVLCRILIRYDLVGVLEIRDSSQEAFPELVGKLNEFAGGNIYEYFTGKRNGRTTSKEQTGFIYRVDKLEVVNVYERYDQYDVLEREPTVVKFQRKKGTPGKQREFTYIPIHIKPDDAVEEMNALIPVCEEAERLNGPDVIIAGDLNADCNYVCKSCWDECQLRQEKRFKWLIDDGIDTTTKKTDCAYDRIILHGENLEKNSCCAQVYRYDRELQLDQELVEDVSDHFPVEFTLL